MFLRQRTILQLMRIYNIRNSILVYLLTRSLSGNLKWDLGIIIYSGLLILLYGWSSIRNYELDIQTDKINKRINPISLHIFSPSQLNNLKTTIYILVVLLTVIGMVSYGINVLFFSASLWFLGWAYSHPKWKLSYYPVAKLVSMLLAYVVIPGLVGLYSGKVTGDNLIIFGSLILMAASWFVYSDIKDIKGDLKVGKKTLANTLGVKKLTRLGLMAGLMSVVILWKMLPADHYFDWIARMGLIFLVVMQIIIAGNPNKFTQDKKWQKGFGYGFYVVWLLLLSRYLISS